MNVTCPAACHGTGGSVASSGCRNCDSWLVSFETFDRVCTAALAIIMRTQFSNPSTPKDPGDFSRVLRGWSLVKAIYIYARACQGLGAAEEEAVVAGVRYTHLYLEERVRRNHPCLSR